MQIFVFFHFNNERSPAAITGIEGDVVDILLPNVGDIVDHRYINDVPFRGRVTERQFLYNIDRGVAVEGAVAVTLCLDRLPAQ